jgi:hypothetical protein
MNVADPNYDRAVMPPALRRLFDRYALKPLPGTGGQMLYRDGIPYRMATDVEVELLADESDST